MIEGFKPKDEELIMNLVTGLMDCTAKERAELLRLTLTFVADSTVRVTEENGDLTAAGMFLGALREMIIRFEGM